MTCLNIVDFLSPSPRESYRMRLGQLAGLLATACTACGEQTAVIGYDESEQLDVEPARYFVRVTNPVERFPKTQSLDLPNECDHVAML